MGTDLSFSVCRDHPRQVQRKETYIKGNAKVFFKYFFNCNVIFKIINKLKVNNYNFKFNNNFKNYIIIKKI